jgi:hypothetical protein
MNAEQLDVFMNMKKSVVFVVRALSPVPKSVICGFLQRARNEW